ncbi:nuclear transport factor 2 family protein [Methylorubrum extorquens]|uniref:nuclear transport factor 2 family protein n=1 Tax=Methylorubrum extorquens TaxID=408 RepID=UPI000159066A|nr:nuclear transport factor 2 family protein [Methylorubrum extorquens]ABY29165.1 conserved hypothetical protein [Methylorubrum extorquens PA1]KQP94186.1 hypothetical protein ASF55_18075 [Methylobacterium sp. Leaf119]WIU40514.1 nuclear transport factor 2 family protein [Methylorubrum extorquens]
MSIQEDVRYLLDRVEIQDKVSLYGLGQDLHQADNPNKNILEQWNDLFTPDARIDISDLGMPECGLVEYAEIMRGKDLRGGGLEVSFKAWQHIEGHANVRIDGDTATSLTLHFHSHEARDGVRNLIDAGYWHDDWVRTPEGWRIRKRRHQALYTNTYPVVAGPAFLDV